MPHKSLSSRAGILDSMPFPLDRSIFDRDDLCIGREGRLSLFYAPFDSVNLDAKVVLLGLTPGWHQMRIGVDAYRSARNKGLSNESAQVAAKASAAFAGTMRARLVTWLNELGVQHRLKIPSAADLFENGSLMHATSLLRYPVFVGDKYENYGGRSPMVEDSPLLRDLVSDLLTPELASLPTALVVPMGVAVARALAQLEVTSRDCCLIGFPHPSGANNGHSKKQFDANRSEMTSVVRRWRLD